MKRIALGIAAAILGVSGVAGATMGVNEIINSDKTADIALASDKLAANCWAVTGAGTNANCTTSGAGAAEVTNLVDGIDLPSTSGLLAGATDLASVAGGVPSVNDVTGLLPAIPTACSTSLPVGVPVPFGAVAGGALGLAGQVDTFVKGLPVPVAVPNLGLPVNAAGVIDTIKGEVNCLGAQGGSLPVAAPCAASLPGLPVAAPEPVAGLVNSVTGTATSATGNALSTNGANAVGLNCQAELPKVGVPAVPSLPVPGVPSLPLPSGVPSLQGTVDAVTGTVSGVTGTVVGPLSDPLTDVLNPVTDTVNGVVNSLPVGVPALPLPTLDCSASAGASSGGLLGSLTGIVTGSCN